MAKTILKNAYKFLRGHEKEVSLNDSYNLQRPFNFRLLLTF